MEEERAKRIFASNKTKSMTRSVFMKFNLYDRLVRLIISLEAILVFDETEPIQNNVAERCSLFLGTSYTERKKIKKFIKDMYHLRSELVHHGHADISKKELDRLTVLTQSLVLNILKRRRRLKIRTQNDFKEWFEKKKLTY